MNAQKNETENRLKLSMPAAQYEAFCTLRASLGSAGWSHSPSGLLAVFKGSERFYINTVGRVLTPAELVESVKTSA